MPYTITLAVIAVLFSIIGAKRYSKALSEYQRDIYYDGNYNKKTLAFINRFENIALTLIMALFVCFFIESSIIEKL
jgi:hypothetical protein